MQIDARLSALRRQLLSTFDAAQLDTFCLDYFADVFNRFTRGMQTEEKVTLLLAHCRRKGHLDYLTSLLPPVPPEDV